MALASTIKFTAITKPAPPITVAVTASEKLFANAFFTVQSPSLDIKHRLQIAIVGLAHSLKATYDYTLGTSQHDYAQLHKDAQCYIGNIGARWELSDSCAAALAGLAWTKGNATDSGLSSDIPTILTEARHLGHLSVEELVMQVIYLLSLYLGT